jgi:hypothetical protein
MGTSMLQTISIVLGVIVITIVALVIWDYLIDVLFTKIQRWIDKE